MPVGTLSHCIRTVMNRQSTKTIKPSISNASRAPLHHIQFDLKILLQPTSSRSSNPPVNIIFIHGLAGSIIPMSMHGILIGNSYLRFPSRLHAYSWGYGSIISGTKMRPASITAHSCLTILHKTYTHPIQRSSATSSCFSP